MLQKTQDYYQNDKEEYDFAKNYIDENYSVLEIGCGKAAFADKIKTIKYTGLEFSKQAILMAERNGKNVINETIQRHSLHHFEKYDVVCSFQVLEHIPVDKINSFLNAAINTLKKGGKFIISVPSADSFVGKISNCTLNLPPHHQTHWHDKTLVKIANIFDLEIKELHHDRLAERNKKEYINIIFNYIIGSKKLVKRQNIFVKINNRIIDKIPQVLKNIGLKILDPHGHSVTIVYKKTK
jgi:cyclopropane fatty-acyl-phospholipid synthase-like methyltransferase